MQAKQTLDPSTVAAALQERSDRNRRETVIRIVMSLCAAFSILITVGIVFILSEVAVQFFTDPGFTDTVALEHIIQDVGPEQGLQQDEIRDLIAKAFVDKDDSERAFRRVARGLDISVEELEVQFEVERAELTGLGAFFATVGNSFRRFFWDNRWTPLFGTKQFGIWTLINGTVMVSLVAMSIAIPLGLLTALYLGLYCPTDIAKYLRPMVELLAGIPTVVYGYFALLYVTPVIQFFFDQTPVFNVLSAGIMMGMMIIPTVGSISLDAIKAVPQTLKDGAYALGATRMEVAIRVVFPAAISGITASIILGISRAVGETMIVTVAGGQQPVSYTDGIISALNPLQSMATMTAYIAQVSLGDSQQGSIQYETLFAVGFVLFIITLTLNLVSRFISGRIREVYE